MADIQALVDALAVVAAGMNDQQVQHAGLLTQLQNNNGLRSSALTTIQPYAPNLCFQYFHLKHGNNMYTRILPICFSTFHF